MKVKIRQFIKLCVFHNKNKKKQKKKHTKLNWEWLLYKNDHSIKKELMEDLGVQMYFTPANYSETNGVVERFHSTPCSTLVEIFRCIKGFRDKMSKPKRLDVIINSPGFVDGSCM